MPKLQFVAKEASEVELTPSLPEPTVASDITEIDGTQGLRVVCFFPFPEDEQVQKVKKSNVYGRATALPVTLNEGRQVFQDPDGNQVLFSAKLSAKQEQATASIATTDAEDDDTED